MGETVGNNPATAFANTSLNESHPFSWVRPPVTNDKRVVTITLNESHPFSWVRLTDFLHIGPVIDPSMKVTHFHG